MRGTFLILIAILVMAAGCTRKIYVPVENTVIRTDTVYSAKFRIDSVILHDSVAVMQKGDTVFMSKYRDKIHVKLMRDTVFKTRYDSVTISKPYPVEKKLTKWQKAKLDLGGIAIGVTAVLIVFLLLIYRFESRAK